MCGFFNVLLRFGWTFTLMEFEGEFGRVWVRNIIAGMEIFRRGVWAVLRIEWEVQKKRREGSEKGDEQFEKMKVPGAEEGRKGCRSFEEMEEHQILVELGMYSLAFIGITTLMAL
ncbi:hypothetical protein TrVE_jg7341 [Triparma verrucosa]|uniref:EXS domain-containing protein n=1 Tax=Triparma verrucosa TaxID=1606542 RepID=A0A9W7BGW0_9STRA|nr:hypothetical protein TrVE_jg7341 [Triparma verrucosa]